MSRTYKRRKKATVELTSLLDLLFVMIFVSLLQQKNQSIPKKEKIPPKKKVTKVKQKPVVPPKKVVKKKVMKKKIIPKLASGTIKATFNFYKMGSGPNQSSGQYGMRGWFDAQKRSIQLNGYKWIYRPKQYDMVPLVGTVDKSFSQITGKVDAPFCQTFSLNRVKKGNGVSPVSGVWKGSYTCGQGKSGLTLTVD